MGLSLGQRLRLLRACQSRAGHMVPLFSKIWNIMKNCNVDDWKSDAVNCPPMFWLSWSLDRLPQIWWRRSCQNGHSRLTLRAFTEPTSPRESTVPTWKDFLCSNRPSDKTKYAIALVAGSGNSNCTVLLEQQNSCSYNGSDALRFVQLDLSR